MKKIKLLTQIFWTKLRLKPCFKNDLYGFALLWIIIPFFSSIFSLMAALILANSNFFLSVFGCTVFYFLCIFIIEPALCKIGEKYNLTPLKEFNEKINSISGYFLLSSDKEEMLRRQLTLREIEIERLRIDSVTQKAPMRKNSNRI